MTNPVKEALRRQADKFERAIKNNETRLLRGEIALGIFVAGALAASIGLIMLIPHPNPSPSSATVDPQGAVAAFSPPLVSAIPAGPAGDAVRRGMAMFDDPGKNAANYVGNAMACKNCHLDSGRRPDSSPMWAAWVSYPQYRKKDNAINTMEDRIRGCFRYSMNAPNSPSGGPPPAGSDVYRDLQAYFHWLASGAPTGQKLTGAGYPKPTLSPAGYDPGRGAALYQQKCSGCHGGDGNGATQPDGSVIYPPLWGARSYNWGAGMARIDLAAGFIRANMPFDQPGSLLDQEAWDIAAFVDSHERPRDPRQTGSVAANAAANFKGAQSYYGKLMGGQLLGTGVAAARR